MVSKIEAIVCHRFIRDSITLVLCLNNQSVNRSKQVKDGKMVLKDFKKECHELVLTFSKIYIFFFFSFKVAFTLRCFKKKPLSVCSLEFGEARWSDWHAHQQFDRENNDRIFQIFTLRHTHVSGAIFVTSDHIFCHFSESILLFSVHEV